MAARKPTSPMRLYRMARKGCGVCVRSAVPSADQKEGHDSYTFSASEQLEEVVDCDKDYCGDEEQEKVLEELVVVGVRMYVPQGEFYN